MKDDQLVLFVGAGTSICAGMPTWREAISLIAERMGINTTDVKKRENALE